MQADKAFFTHTIMVVGNNDLGRKRRKNYTNRQGEKQYFFLKKSHCYLIRQPKKLIRVIP